MPARKQIPLLTREQLGFYSRVEVALVLSLLVLESQGYCGSSIRALSAFFGHTWAATHRATVMAYANGLITYGHNGRAKTVSLTHKGKELVNGAIKRVIGTKRVAGEVHGTRGHGG